MLDKLSLVVSVVVAILWSIGENRYWFEGPLCISTKLIRFDWNLDDFIKHFKIYHWVMTGIFVTICIPAYVYGSIYQFIMQIMLMPLIVDFLWFEWERRKRHRDDWSNLGGFPLVFGMFLWYYIVGFISLILFIISVAC